MGLGWCKLREYQTRLNVTDSDKHPSLLRLEPLKLLNSSEQIPD
jgi:hypothetical protein